MALHVQVLVVEDEGDLLVVVHLGDPAKKLALVRVTAQLHVISTAIDSAMIVFLRGVE